MLVATVVCIFFVCSKKTIIKSIICVVLIIAILLPTVKKETVFTANQKIITMDMQVSYSKYTRHINTIIKTEKNFFICEGNIPQAKEMQRTDINTFLYIFNKKVINLDSYTILKINDVDYFVRIN